MNILAGIPATAGEPFSSHIQASFHIFTCKNRISDYKTGNIRAVAAGEPVADVPAAGLLAIGIPAIVGRPIYYISELVFDFPLIKIVFLIVKLVTQGQEVRVY